MIDEALPDFDRLWDYDDPTVSERRFRELLPAAEARRIEGYRAELLTQVAWAEGLQGEFGRAEATLDEAGAGLAGGAGPVGDADRPPVRRAVPALAGAGRGCAGNSRAAASRVGRDRDG